MITIYSKKVCPKCKQAKFALSMEGFQYIEKNMSEDNEALAEIKEQGFQQAPIFKIGNTYFTNLNEVLQKLKG